MKVKELIKKLQELDPENMVVISGYEGGLNEITMIEEVKIKKDVNSVRYYGKHEEVGKKDNEFDCKAIRLD